ncbi:hypothetical protein ACFSO0_17865 [Brevibacillus sp. GCM10020057]|uniref:hypothetical protein n=1 Tax=Brevibacillus sp. GCM10020057 TaxID=3317327 RepID=UPI0036400B7B
MDRSVRKLEHIQHALSTNPFARNAFDDVSFVPNSLPGIPYESTSLACDLGPFRLASPIQINAMTGGADATTTINRKLAVIARERGLAMVVGSQMAALRDQGVRDSYCVVRKENPHGIVFANIGAEATVAEASAAVEMLEADGLQIHLNVMQELQQAGISLIDVGGKGGTNFAKVENMRRDEPLWMFEDWGLSTVESLLEASCVKAEGLSLIATGGIRHDLDAAKAIALGEWAQKA